PQDDRRSAAVQRCIARRTADRSVAGGACRPRPRRAHAEGGARSALSAEGAGEGREEVISEILMVRSRPKAGVSNHEDFAPSFETPRFRAAPQNEAKRGLTT